MCNARSNARQTSDDARQKTLIELRKHKKKLLNEAGRPSGLADWKCCTKLGELSAQVAEPAKDTSGRSSDYPRRMWLAVILDETCLKVRSRRDFRYFDKQKKCARKIGKW